MTPEERQLIADLFDRMRQYGSPEKDRDAEALINQQVRAIPDATYMLVQSVLVQEHALREADQRMQDLEARVRELEEPPPPRREASGGSFLGGLLGGRSDPARPSSVPPTGSRVSATDYGRPGPYGSDRDMGAPPPPAPPPPQGGGFLRSAMSTAAGVAGGMMVADTIRNMLGGGAHAAGAPASGSASDILRGPGDRKSDAQALADADRTQDEEQDRADDEIEEADYDDGDYDSGDGGDMDV
jgi:hypothetical protein